MAVFTGSAGYASGSEMEMPGFPVSHCFNLGNYNLACEGLAWVGSMWTWWPCMEQAESQEAESLLPLFLVEMFPYSVCCICGNLDLPCYLRIGMSSSMCAPSLSRLKWLRMGKRRHKRSTFAAVPQVSGLVLICMILIQQHCTVPKTVLFLFEVGLSSFCFLLLDTRFLYRLLLDMSKLLLV